MRLLFVASVCLDYDFASPLHVAQYDDVNDYNLCCLQTTVQWLAVAAHHAQSYMRTHLRRALTAKIYACSTPYGCSGMVAHVCNNGSKAQCEEIPLSSPTMLLFDSETVMSGVSSTLNINSSSKSDLTVELTELTVHFRSSHKESGTPIHSNYMMQEASDALGRAGRLKYSQYLVKEWRDHHRIDPLHPMTSIHDRSYSTEQSLLNRKLAQLMSNELTVFPKEPKPLHFNPCAVWQTLTLPPLIRASTLAMLPWLNDC
eukprot:m.234457 g.234457  ORF g.234457 m.234457 type:complete len:258 (+) comp15257_c1_seq1:985-1758(+)